jgi:hypothetical protein
MFTFYDLTWSAFKPLPWVVIKQQFCATYLLSLYKKSFPKSLFFIAFSKPSQPHKTTIDYFYYSNLTATAKDAMGIMDNLCDFPFIF